MKNLIFQLKTAPKKLWAKALFDGNTFKYLLMRDKS